MRADAVASGNSASKSVAPRRRARGPRVRVVEAWVFTCRFRTYCHVLTGCGRTPVWSQCTAYRFSDTGFVSGYRFSDTASFSKSDAPLGAGIVRRSHNGHGRRMLFRMADGQHAPSIPLHVDRFMYRVAENVRARFAAAVVQIRDPANVVLRFPEMRNARAARHRSRTSVIGCQTEADVAAVTIQKLP